MFYIFCIYGSPFHHATAQVPLALGLIGRDGGLSTLCHSCGFTCQQRLLKTWPWLSPLQGWGSLTMAFTDKFVYIFIIYLLRDQEHVHIITKDINLICKFN